MDDEQKDLLENQKLLHALKSFLEQRTHGIKSETTDRPKELFNEMRIKKGKMFEKKTAVFRNLLMEKYNKWTNSIFDELNKAKVQKFWERVAELYKTDMSQCIDPLKNESSYPFENTQNETEILSETFFKWKQLTKSNFDNNFYDAINGEVVQLSVEAGSDFLWWNNPLS